MMRTLASHQTRREISCGWLRFSDRETPRRDNVRRVAKESYNLDCEFHMMPMRAIAWRNGAGRRLTFRRTVELDRAVPNMALKEEIRWSLLRFSVYVDYASDTSASTCLTLNDHNCPRDYVPITCSIIGLSNHHVVQPNLMKSIKKDLL